MDENQIEKLAVHIGTVIIVERILEKLEKDPEVKLPVGYYKRKRAILRGEKP